MKTAEIRKSFLNFFKSKDHKVIKSDSLVPQGDPSVLFTGAGMNQFKENFLGLKTDLKRAASVQKCLRTGDLDEVGRTPYHHSFFEMLGNFSFGDYFKDEAIRWAWEYLTVALRIPADRLFISVHESDGEALEIWTKGIGVKESMIAKMGDHTNFWPADAPQKGPNGPCGPCSEIYFDQRTNNRVYKDASWIQDESGRFAEIWNLVFTQFDRQPDGTLTPLQNKNIDTGMGLERLACVLQNKSTNFEIDIFRGILDALEKQMIEKNVPREKFYAIADHLRASVMAIADGVHPSNEGRGYVVRKLLRRCIWQGRLLGINAPFLTQIVPTVVASLSDAYPEVARSEPSLKKTIALEETRFLETLDKGLQVVSELMEHVKKSGEKELPAESVFQLYDTYGFPIELTEILAKEKKLSINHEKFERLLELQKKRAKEASKISESIFSVGEYDTLLKDLPPTRFLGYTSMANEAKVLLVHSVRDQTLVVLDQTPFYAESGGQVGDRGIIRSTNFLFSVDDTQKKDAIIIHFGRVLEGMPEVGQGCQANVDCKNRESIKRNHTATHLLQSALRSVLGEHVRQVGSLVSAEKLRFDFSQPQPLSKEEISKVQNWVNEAILANHEVLASEETYEDAAKGGALAFFGEKYGDRVRVIDVPGKSKEFCGGTHCGRTGDIGSFIIVSESSIGSGTRRIEAITGSNTLTYVMDLQSAIRDISNVLKTSPVGVLDRIEKMQKKLKDLERSSSRGKDAGGDYAASLLESSKSLCGLNVIASKLETGNIPVLREITDELRKKLSRGLVVLFSSDENRVHMVAALTKDLDDSKWDVRKVAARLMPFIDGSAGGRKDWVQGGGKKQDGIDVAIKELPEILQSLQEG